MNGFDVYKKYLAVSLHYKNGGYDFFKYGSKFKKIGRETYENRKDKIFFEVIAEKVPSIDIDFMFGAIFFDRPKTYVKDILSKECQDIYLKRKGIRDSLDYTWQQDLICLKRELNEMRISLKDSVNAFDDPPLFKIYRYKIISPETVIILDKIFSLFSKWDGKIKDSIVYPRERDRLKKYAPFLGTIDVKRKIEKIKEIYVNHR